MNYDEENDLDVIDLSTQINKELSDFIEYPCVEIRGITLQEEIEFISKRIYDNSLSLPLYFNAFGFTKKIGHMELTLENLLKIKSIYPYELVLRASDDKERVLDLNDPNTYINIMKL